MNSLQGHFLVASPHLPDTNFYRSVVLLIQHDQEGAFGLVLNRPTQNTVSEIWEAVCGQPCDSQQPINLGGPVAGPLMALHTDEICSENEILPGVYLATQKEHLRRIVSQDDRPFRIFTGYAGWGGGQLESELEVGGWLTAPATIGDIFYGNDDLWQKVARQIGLEILAPTIRNKRLPQDPSMN